MRALIVVDEQPDFMPGGPLPAPGGGDVVPITNQLMKRFDIVVASQDWHPPDHVSFASNHENKEPGETVRVTYEEIPEGIDQILWPDHCVQDTRGAELHPDLNREQIQEVFQKGVDPKIDSYSAFYDNAHLRATGLGDYLKSKGVDEVFIAGLATDVCVKFTALDAVKENFRTSVIFDATRGVNMQEGDVDRALEEMREAGVRLVKSEDV